MKMQPARSFRQNLTGFNLYKFLKLQAIHT